MSRLAVFCGSAVGNKSSYRRTAEDLGRRLGERGTGLVYGGGRVGLMGILADAALAAGAEVHGVLLRALATKEVAHSSITELHVVETMHERKALMAELADGFVALPGGYGTFDELMEVVTWAQLGVHQKPVALLDVDGYFQPLLALVDRAIDDGFIRREQRAFLLVAGTIEDLFERLDRFRPLDVPEWLTSRWT